MDAVQSSGVGGNGKEWKFKNAKDDEPPVVFFKTNTMGGNFCSSASWHHYCLPSQQQDGINCDLRFHPPPPR